MSRTHKKNANPEKYIGKAYLTYEESIDFLGISLSTLTRYVADEKIETHKFHRDKKRYLATGDVKQIEDLIKNPWKRTVPATEKPDNANALDENTQCTTHPLQGEQGHSEDEKSEPDAA